jgi:hypothetical protein
MCPLAKLTTYSRAGQVRRAMVEAGFSIAPLQSEKFQKQGTLASKGPLENQIIGEPLKELRGSIRDFPYHDNLELSLSRPQILENRIVEKKNLRALKMQ